MWCRDSWLCCNLPLSYRTSETFSGPLQSRSVLQRQWFLGSLPLWVSYSIVLVHNWRANGIFRIFCGQSHYLRSEFFYSCGLHNLQDKITTWLPWRMDTGCREGRSFTFPVLNKKLFSRALGNQAGCYGLSYWTGLRSLYRGFKDYDRGWIWFRTVSRISTVSS